MTLDESILLEERMRQEIENKLTNNKTNQTNTN